MVFVVICDDKPLKPHRCALDSPCSLRTIWHELREHVDLFLRSYTLEDLVDGTYHDDSFVKIGGVGKNRRRPKARAS